MATNRFPHIPSIVECIVFNFKSTLSLHQVQIVFSATNDQYLYEVYGIEQNDKIWLDTEYFGKLIDIDTARFFFYKFVNLREAL